MAASVTSAAATMSLTRSHSLVVWMSRIPVPRFTTSSPRRFRMFASHPPPMPAAVIVRPTRAAADHDLDQVRARRAREGEAHGVAVEHEAATGADPPEVEVAGAEEAHLLADREHDVERRVAEASLAAHADALADDRHARLVVAAEHGRAVAPDHVVLDDGAHAGAGLDRVHVRAEEERRRVHAAGHVRDQVPSLAADLR